MFESKHMNIEQNKLELQCFPGMVVRVNSQMR